MNLHRSRITATLALATVALLSASCLWGQRSGLGILAGARSAGMDAETVSFTLETTFDGMDDEALLDGMSFKAHGSTDSSNDRGFMVFEIAGSEMEIRYLDGKSYIRFMGDTWVESEDDDEDFFDVFSSFDPFDILEELGADDSDVEHVGSGEVHGKKVEKYTVSIDADALEDSSLSDLMPPNTPVVLDVWIDSDGRPAHLGYNFEVAPGTELGLGNTEAVRFSITIKLFDYGKPVSVEAPPADKIGKAPALGSLGGLGGGDPFAGADCYGDKLQDCFAPDPATDAMASNPDLCRSIEPRVCLVPVGKVRPDVVKAILDFHRDTKGIEVVVLPSIPLQAADVRVGDSQITAEQVYRKLQSAYGVGNQSASTYIGMTSIDIVPEDDKYGWMFGQRTGTGPYGNRHGVFSYFRMVNVEPYNGKSITDELIHLRVAKYAARYTTILYLHVPLGDDIKLLNYRDMFGFSDLDSIGTAWPSEDLVRCSGRKEAICVIPDGDYADPQFLPAVKRAVERLAREGYPVELFEPYLTKYVPTKPDWGEEFGFDLFNRYGSIPKKRGDISLLGVTDNSLAQDATVQPHFEQQSPAGRITVVSTGDIASTPGASDYEERLYRMMLRALLNEHYGVNLNSDPSSLMYAGAFYPADLDGKTIPPIPRR